MKAITNTEAYEIIKKFGIRGAVEADALEFHIKYQNDDTESYCDAGAVVVIYHDKSADYVSVTPFAEYFSIEAVCELIESRCKNPVIQIDTHSLDPDFAAQLDEAISPIVLYRRSLADYAFTGEGSPTADEGVRFLTASDKDRFEAVPYEKPVYRPPLSVLFDCFVNKGQGYVLGAFDGDDIVGFLSFIAIGEKVFDVDYVHVAPESRGKGIGKRLGLAYRTYALENDSVAYWSNARNEASENTAKSCGFERVRNVRIYTR